MVLENCPICNKPSFFPSGVSVSLPDKLRHWEETIGRPFPEKVWSDYQQYQYRPLDLKECTACGFGRFEPAVSGSSEFYACISAVDYYNEEKWEFGAALHQLQLAGAKRILDVGCGSGIFLDYLQRQMYDAQLFGSDLNIELLASLEARGLSILHGDLDQIKERSGEVAPFDAICMMQVLEHANDPIDMLQTFLGLLRPGGLLIITTPDAAGPIKNFPDALTETPPHHLTRWTEATFKVLFKRLKLKLCSVQTEPLPDYLWDSYLPVIWDEPIWPAQVFDPLAKSLGMATVGERSGFAAQLMKEAGIRRLYGVPGHTIFAAATSEGE
jgi:2-polyprenyl-3-methyl-5-hydroxy-6-metoxy-1,4-benzoquinol methylase